VEKIPQVESDPIHLEAEIGNQLSQLLSDLEFSVDNINEIQGRPAPDFIARKLLNTNKEYRIAIEIKSNSNYRDAIKYGIRTLESIRQIKKFDKLLLVLSSPNRTTFKSTQSYNQIARNRPTEIEIIDIKGLQNWASNLRTEFSKEEINEVQILIRKISQKFISLIAKNPDYLLSLEWRDLERAITELFNEIGFDATLTPGSKDGGKDVVLECEINNEKKSYIIEIKHWRSGQKVGKKSVKEFTQVIINEKRSKGLYLSTYGYSDNYLESLTQIERDVVKFGDKDKIIELCNTYEKVRNGIWIPMNALENILFENTK